MFSCLAIAEPQKDDRSFQGSCPLRLSARRYSYRCLRHEYGGCLRSQTYTRSASLWLTSSAQRPVRRKGWLQILEGRAFEEWPRLAESLPVLRLDLWPRVK